MDRGRRCSGITKIDRRCRSRRTARYIDVDGQCIRWYCPYHDRENVIGVRPSDLGLRTRPEIMRFTRRYKDLGFSSEKQERVVLNLVSDDDDDLPVPKRIKIELLEESDESIDCEQQYKRLRKLKHRFDSSDDERGSLEEFVVDDDEPIPAEEWSDSSLERIVNKYSNKKRKRVE